MGDHEQTAKYLVLKHAQPAAFKDRLLGCVVHDIYEPFSGIQPSFALTGKDATDNNSSAQGPGSDSDRLKSVMNSFLMENLKPDPQNPERYVNQVNLTNLLTEKSVEEDFSVRTSLTKLLTAHYRTEDKSDFGIEAAFGKRYHLHNAIYKFEDELWSNKYYRDSIQKIIRHKRTDGSLETLDDVHRAYHVKKSPHKCEVIVLPMIVGILTCEEVKVSSGDNTGSSKGFSADVPVDQLAGLPTNGMFDTSLSMDASRTSGGRVSETIPDEVIVAIAYDLIAIPTGKPDPAAKLPTTRDSRWKFWKSNQKQSKLCQACLDSDLTYNAAWRHAPIRTSNSHGINLNMGAHHDDQELSAGDIDFELGKTQPDLANAEVELYIGSPENYVLAEQLYGVSPSSTGSTTRSRELRRERTDDAQLSGHAS